MILPAVTSCNWQSILNHVILSGAGVAYSVQLDDRG
jgi:hypothetical protein